METIVIKYEGRNLVARHSGRAIAKSEIIFLADIRSSVLGYADQFSHVKVIYRRRSGPISTSDTTLFRKNKMRGLRIGVRGWIDPLL
ncbi:Hypothetical protein HEAR3045 [Herminiimonas arsenicoxydans]|uniref:Uncharacterized protein n=1 Tax=Herminiimonas arsenicoxydans TaxID=204773 RepID=A4G9G7_HERAR|nr:Hypothetical protein HEAR3045 [Herminiimonas arsenicoxydans]